MIKENIIKKAILIVMLIFEPGFENKLKRLIFKNK